jgi:predicted transcriptional regulator
MDAVSRKLATSVTFDPEVISYLDDLARAEERTRSQVISRIVKEHASQNGRPLESQKTESQRLVLKAS